MRSFDQPLEHRAGFECRDLHRGRAEHDTASQSGVQPVHDEPAEACVTALEAVKQLKHPAAAVLADAGGDVVQAPDSAVCAQVGRSRVRTWGGCRFVGYAGARSVAARPHASHSPHELVGAKRDPVPYLLRVSEAGQDHPHSFEARVGGVLEVGLTDLVVGRRVRREEPGEERLVLGDGVHTGLGGLHPRVGGRHRRDGESASDAIGGVSYGCALREVASHHAMAIALWILQASSCVAA